MTRQGLANITKWWLVFPIFAGLGTITMLMVFIGEGIRNAMDPRKAISIKLPKRYRAAAPQTQEQRGMTLLDVRNLDVFFDTPEGRVVGAQDISFQIEPGRTTALVGESGSGKTVSAMSILQLLPYPVATHSDRSQVLWKGANLLHANQRSLRGIRGNEISMIFQEPQISLNPVQKIDRQVAEIMMTHQRMDMRKARQLVPELLEDVGLRDPKRQARSYPHQLSGGQRQRVMIAMALANDPDLLIADEPTTALDVTVQAQILELLRQKQRERNMAMLLITHDLDVVRAMADDVVVMERGDVVETGARDAVLVSPSHPYTQKLVASQPSGEPSTLCPHGAKTVVRQPILKVHFPILAGVLKRQVGAVKAVDGVTCRSAKAKPLGVVGESGSGKSTLGMALLRLGGLRRANCLPQSRTSMRFEPKQMVPLRREMQVVFQDPFSSLSPRMSVSEIIGEGLRIHAEDLSDEAAEQRVIDALAGCRPGPLGPAPVSARVQRRPAPADRGCAGADPSAQAAHPRRANLRAGYDRSGAAAGPAADAARRIWAWRTCSSPTILKWCGPCRIRFW